MSDKSFPPPSCASEIMMGGGLIHLRSGWKFKPDGGGSVWLLDPGDVQVNRWNIAAAKAFALAQLGQAVAASLGTQNATDDSGQDLWHPISECPRDLDGSHPPRIWRLRCINPRAFRAGIRYTTEEEALLSAPFETLGRASRFCDSGWAEGTTGRELWPIEYAEQSSAS